MALTKHQKLAKEIQHVFTRLDQFYKKVTKTSNYILQFYFYEPYLSIDCPFMTKPTVLAMMYTHKLGLIYFSPNQTLRESCLSKQLSGLILYPPIYAKSNVRINSPGNPPGAKCIIPWKLEIHTPSKSSESLKKAYAEAMLYCAAESEMSEWIDWFEEEDKSNTFTNLILSISVHQSEQTILKRNLIKPVYQCFEKAIIQFCEREKLNPLQNTLLIAKFAPNKETSVAQAYEKIIYSIKSRKDRQHDDFKPYWKSVLEKLIFENLPWNFERKNEYLERWVSSKKIKKTKERWETSQAIDRQTFSSFIQYFFQNFIKDPISNKCHGEVVLFLWISAQIAQDPDNSFTVKEILKLTTTNLDDRIIHLSKQEIIITVGLADLLKTFIGTPPFKRQQKLFPNLTIDRLEDLFHRASLKILPEGDPVILPEAFITFPHALDHVRMIAKHRKQMQKNPPKNYQKLPSRHEIKKHLFKTKPLKA